jgi:hypothetical protein
MKPFTLEELIQACVFQVLFYALTYPLETSRPLQHFEGDEEDLQQFFRLYGPSARDCYAFCTRLLDYRKLLHERMGGMTWPTITDALKGIQALRLDHGSHKIILVTPNPTERESYWARIITKEVSRMLSERDTNERWRNCHNLYQTMRLEPLTKSSAGWLMEPPFHALCLRGVTFRIYPMQFHAGGRVNDIFVNPVYKDPVDIVLAQLQLVLFDASHPIAKIQQGYYYQPRHGTQPSFDSFIYTTTPPRITFFQVTDGETHDVKPLGINFILDIIKEQGPVPELRFVVVIPEGDGVRCEVRKSGNLLMKMFFLGVQENQLFPF